MLCKVGVDLPVTMVTMRIRVAHTALLAPAILGLAAALAGDEKPAEGVSVTIYNAPREETPHRYYAYNEARKPSGWAVVKLRTKVQLPDGVGEVRIRDVAAGIVPTSVSFKSLTDAEHTTVLEQNFLYDLASVPAILHRYLDRRVGLVGPAGGAVLEGSLLNAQPEAELLLQVPGSPEPLRLAQFSELRLPALPEGLVTRPTLHWKIKARKKGEHLAEITYLTDHLTWRADYTLVIPGTEEKFGLSGWATIENDSGATYSQARLKLMGGDVQRIQEPELGDSVFMAAPRAAAKEADASERFVEKSFFEYHLYTLGRPTTIPDHSSKQIELFAPASDVPFKRVYVYEGARVPEYYRQRGGPVTDDSYGVPTNTKVDVYLEFKNDEKSHLGMPLPAGHVRVYMRDPDDKVSEFIGEDEIEHTPKDEKVRVRMGEAFDVAAERRRIGFTVNADACWLTESFEVRVRNHKPDGVTVFCHEDLYRWVSWKIEPASHPFEKLSAQKVRFVVDVPAGGEKVLTYTVRYSW